MGIPSRRAGGADGGAALEAVNCYGTDVVLLDVQLPAALRRDQPFALPGRRATAMARPLRPIGAFASKSRSDSPVKELRPWLEAAGIHPGPVFRRMRRGDNLTAERLSDQSVALIVKRRAQAAGLPPEDLSGHSLRAGYTTAAAAAGIEERKIANVTRHKNRFRDRCQWKSGWMAVIRPGCLAAGILRRPLPPRLFNILNRDNRGAGETRSTVGVNGTSPPSGAIGRQVRVSRPWLPQLGGPWRRAAASRRAAFVRRTVKLSVPPSATIVPFSISRARCWESRAGVTPMRRATAPPVIGWPSAC
jgi:hypothetical protein